MRVESSRPVWQIKMARVGPINAGSRLSRAAKGLSFSRASAIYIWIVVIVIFSAWKPGVFPEYATVTEVLNGNAITAILALAIIFALSTGAFDLSVAYSFGFTSVLMAWLLGNTSIPIAACIAICLVGSLLIGVVNGAVVVVMGIDSFIGTLATGSLLQAGILLVSDDQQLSANINRGGFTRIVFASWHQVSAPVFYALILTVLLWYFLQHTARGRFAYATGLAPEAARLAGIRTGRLQFAAFLVSALLAGFAGVLITGIVGGGSPTVGPPYLIPVFAAAFLGATQFKGGLFNAWGTLVAVMLLGTVDAGLALASVPQWTPYVFTGAVLILALAISGMQRRGRRPRANRPVTADGSYPENLEGGNLVAIPNGRSHTTAAS